MQPLPPRSASLEPFFRPLGIAVIGASRDPGKLSYGVLTNLLDPEHRFPGPVYPVNPKADEILGLRCYPDVTSVPDPVELAILVIPAGAVPASIEACGQRGIKAAIVISGGFREVGPDGAALEQQMVEIAKRYDLRVMGPNGIGIIDTGTPLNTTFVRGVPPKGPIAFMSQSGALCGGIIDWSIGEGIGFSRFLSVGNEADVNESDILPFLAADEKSKVIALYLEDVKGGPRFVDALREAAARKPILAMKSGRTSSGQAATASHTGALASPYAAFHAACRQSGVVEVQSIKGLFDGALALAYQPLPAGNRIAIVTNAGGPAAVAADSFEKSGLVLATISDESHAELRRHLHPDAQVAGLVDMLGGADETNYRRAMDVILADPNVDGILAIVIPHALVNPAAIVKAIGEATDATHRTKPVVACMLGHASLESAFASAHAIRIPAYTFPEDAVAAYSTLLQRVRLAATIASRQTPAAIERNVIAKVRETVDQAKSAGLRGLDAAAARSLLEAYGIAAPIDFLATTPDETAEYARRVGFPVALKLASPDILHKSDIGGVVLNVADANAASAAFKEIVSRGRSANPRAEIRGVQVQPMITGGHEIIVGAKRDATFGPLVMFGMGGIYVEALSEVSFRLAPLTLSDAWEMIEEVRAARLLKGLRGSPAADRAALADTIVKVGQLTANHPEIQELDINPLLVLSAGKGVLAVDARIILG